MKTLYYHLFTDPRLDFDQASPWHELKDGVLVLHSNDEDEAADVARDQLQLLDGRGMP